MTIDTDLSPAIIDQLEIMFERDRPDAIRNTLLEVYHIFLTREHENLPVNFDDMARHVNGLADLLKIATQEMRT